MGTNGVSVGQWRPPQWSAPAMVSITANTTPPTQSTPTNDSQGGLFQVQSFSQTYTPITYVFDAVFMLEHDQELITTNHPIQTGADISSHAYLMPARLTLNIGMSDAMDSYAASTTPQTTGQYPNYSPWTGAGSKSVSAYQTILGLQAARQPLTVTTRIRTYSNMIITAVRPREDSRTIAGLRMSVDFKEIFTASISTGNNSVRSNTTDTTGLGQVNTAPPSATTVKQFNVANYIAPSTAVEFAGVAFNALSIVPTAVPGAGFYSGVAVASLQELSLAVNLP